MPAFRIIADTYRLVIFCHYYVRSVNKQCLAYSILRSTYNEVRNFSRSTRTALVTTYKQVTGARVSVDI